jgi:molybdopterin-guanine dinucleotide biosynthesis protein A
MTIAAAIIAGGKGSRMGGVFKPGLEIDGTTVLDRQLDVLRGHFDDIFVCASNPRDFERWSLPVVPDAEIGAGPMAGLLAALEATSADHVFAVAGDMPYITSAAVDAVLAGVSDEVDVVMPVTDRSQPLFAVYSRRMAPFLRERLTSGHRAMRDLGSAALLGSAGLVLRVLAVEELRKIDGELRFLGNINRPQDLP